MQHLKLQPVTNASFVSDTSRRINTTTPEGRLVAIESQINSGTSPRYFMQVHEQLSSLWSFQTRLSGVGVGTQPGIGRLLNPNAGTRQDSFTEIAQAP